MVTKIEAAEKQLDTAINLFFENVDHLSCYTLAAASREITDDLGHKKKDELFRSELNRLGDAQKVRLSFRDELKIRIKPEHFKEALGLFRKKQNFLKHANTDHDQGIEEISVDELAFLLLFAVRNFSLLAKRWTPAMSTFFCWFAASKPHLMRLDENDDFSKVIVKMQKYFTDLSSKQTFSAFYRVLDLQRKGGKAS